MMATTLLFDFMSRGFGHTSFNRCLAEVALNMPGCDRVEIHAEAEHLKWLGDLLSPALAAQCSLIEVAGVSTSVQAPLFDAWRRCEAAVQAIGTALSRSQADRVFVLGYTGLLLRQVRRSGLEKRAWIGLLGHGNVAEVMLPRRRNPLVRFRDMNTQLQQALPKGQDLIALEHGIAGELEQHWGVSKGRIRVIELPIVPEEACDLNQVQDQPPGKTGLDVGFLGDPRPQKGFGQFLGAAQALQASALRFHAIGRQVDQMPTAGLQALVTPPSARPYGRDEYLAAIRALDLVCVPFLPDYRLIPSASLTDAVAQLKPLIYPLEPAFIELTRRYGPLGYGYDAGTPMQQVLSSLSRERFLADLPALRASLSRFQADRLPSFQGRRFSSERS